jgi:sarcosine oxidase
MGSSTAWWLARRGVDVLLVEQFEQGHERGSSHGGTRIFRRAYTDPFYVSLAGEALDDWRALEDEAGEPLLDLVGVIDHGDPEIVDEVAAAMAAAGMPAERLPVGDAGARFPQYRFDRSVLFRPPCARSSAAPPTTGPTSASPPVRSSSSPSATIT